MIKQFLLKWSVTVIYIYRQLFSFISIKIFFLLFNRYLTIIAETSCTFRMCHSTRISDWQEDKYQEYGSIFLEQTAGLLWKCVSVHAPVRLPFARCLCFADCVLR